MQILRWGLLACALTGSGLAMAQPQASAAPPPLRFAVGQAWSEPFAHWVDGRLQGGILFELTQQIAANAGTSASYRVLPARRVDEALAAGLVDLHCLLSPSWVESRPAPERWSVPVLQLDDVLLAPASHAGGRVDLAAAKALSIGAVMSYQYPTLEPLFSGGQLRRDDAPSQERVLEKLQRGRTQFAVANSLMADWYNKRLAPGEQLKALQTVDSVMTYCLLAPKTGLAPQRIQAAVRRLVDSGQLRAILRRYK